MQTEEQIRLATFDIFEQLRQDNILYAELLLVPFMHTSQGLSAEQVVEILNDAVTAASSEAGLEARVILSTLRHYSMQQSLATVKLVERFVGTHIAGVDLGAYEAGFPIYAHIPAFQYAAQQGIPRTVHAGEAALRILFWSNTWPKSTSISSYVLPLMYRSTSMRTTAIILSTPSIELAFR
jgi:adenosine deaminase